MKKVLRILSLALVCAFAVILAACDDGIGAGGSAKGSSDIDISEPTFGFVRQDQYDPETFDPEKVDVDTSYYLFVNFDITAARNNDGQSLLDVNVTFDNLQIMEGTMEDVSSGLIQNMVIDDAQTGNLSRVNTISFKIPSLSTEPKTIKMIVKLVPMQVGESHIIFGFKYNPSVGTTEEYRLLGSDGRTKNLTIKAVQIGQPALTVASNGFLSWAHVKNAEYYCIYADGSTDPLQDYDGQDIQISAEGYVVGDEISYNVGQYIEGDHLLRIRAFSNNPNVTPSSFSNQVEHMW